VFVAELDDGKRKVLEDALSPLHLFSDVSEVEGKSLPVDVLCITPPCVDVTRNRRVFNRLGGVPVDLVARGAAAVAGQLAAIVDAVHSSSPSVIVVEQSPGLASHHSAAYEAFNAGIQRLPYIFYHGSVEASAVCGASHARDRLVWIGIRPSESWEGVRVSLRGS
jgi:site-specific DNA-cytosine methylase